MPQYVRLLGIFAMVLSVISMMGALGGLLIGTVLGVIGGSLGAAWDPAGDRSRKQRKGTGKARKIGIWPKKKAGWPIVARMKRDGGADR